MRVFFSRGQIREPYLAHRVQTSTNPTRWTAAYLRAFYGSEELAGVVNPIVASFVKSRHITLLESRIRGETAGTLALFRTPGLVGVYCVGTVPEHRRKGVATGLLARAREIADSEGRAMILQSLESEGAGQFYLDRGFDAVYSKRVFEKSSKGNGGKTTKWT
jgi:GNAT superfamily N-acetyltransferase